MGFFFSFGFVFLFVIFLFLILLYSTVRRTVFSVTLQKKTLFLRVGLDVYKRIIEFLKVYTSPRYTHKEKNIVLTV